MTLQMKCSYRCLKSIDQSLASWGHFMEKTKNMLRKFHSCTLNAVRRDANLAARCLARRHTVNVDG